MTDDTRLTLANLEANDQFVGRHIGPDQSETDDMLNSIGVHSLAGLIDQAMPSAIRDADFLGGMSPHTEQDALDRLRALASQNQPLSSFIGTGYYDCITPPVIRRNLLENPGWYTAYTPYQPEISQGRLEALINYQTMVSDLTGMDIANASLLDEATAAAEAMTLVHRVGKSKSDRFFVADSCHPQTIAVMQTRAESLGIDLAIGPVADALSGDAIFGALVQYPDSFGAIGDHRAFVDAVHAQKGLVVVASDLLALTLLEAPGHWGADVVIGSSQRFGVPMMYGGPHAAFMATRDAYKRSVPGRLIGVSVDSAGRPAYRLALQTREQHIRREKATSNICTAQVLLAVVAGMYAVWHGAEGLTNIARRVHRLTVVLAEGLRRGGLDVETSAFFDTISVRVPGQAQALAAAATKAGYNLREIDADRIGLSVDEAKSASDIEAIWHALLGDKAAGLRVADLDTAVADALPAAQKRTSAFLTHPTFRLYRSETEMLRYLKRLERKDLTLADAMIPLGSCTMKLNAVAEMEAVTWPEFAGMHPFAPKDQAQGYRTLIGELEAMLAEITGFHAVSLQPNAGSQGEYAGLMVIRAYHRSRDQGHRNVCLIPSSAHGTNPASAVMAGMRVAVVGCDDNGNIDMDDLRAKAAKHADDLAALMVTYPSTHGVFEETITEICDIIHAHGGQVYMDGANMNALVGLARPGRFGPDVMHLNLHKTFCIPHGGGGPGVGPIGVAEHLAPYLPGHPLVPECGGAQAIGPVAAAPWGSAGILAISWAYIYMMGGAGLTRATELAILSANYIAHRLGGVFPVLYTGANGRVAHECIIDLRQHKDAVSVDDVAKRLIDFGFHAPTMSFPVAGTLMIEPTESESKAELDRFCTAMLVIRDEIRAVEAGHVAPDESVLHHAPHTAVDLTADEWTRAYSREQAAYPVASLRDGKYWPPVSRIDNVQGDRNVVCSCPPLEAYQQAAE